MPALSSVECLFSALDAKPCKLTFHINYCPYIVLRLKPSLLYNLVITTACVCFEMSDPRAAYKHARTGSRLFPCGYANRVGLVVLSASQKKLDESEVNDGLRSDPSMVH